MRAPETSKSIEKQVKSGLKCTVLAGGLALALAGTTGAAQASGPLQLQPFLNQAPASDSALPLDLQYVPQISPSAARPETARVSFADQFDDEIEDGYYDDPDDDGLIGGYRNDIDAYDDDDVYFDMDAAPSAQPLAPSAPDIVMRSDTPENRYDTGLQRALERYRAIADNGGWAAIPAGATLRPGDRDPRVRDLRRRLAVTGDLPRRTVRNSTFDPGLERAVRRFQARMGLKVDGIVGPNTLTALNVPVERRIRQISLNLQRWRQSAPELGQRFVLVNIPAYELDVFEHDRQVMNMKVVVGRAARPTPVFSDQIDYIEFNPYWNVPASIARRDLVPKFIENPGYAARGNYKVIYRGEIYDAAAINWRPFAGTMPPVRIRQNPGPNNALGEMKFMFPNRYNVYLHDTPSKHLFSRTNRAYSSGCIRVERPDELARYLLRDKDGWSPSRIDHVVAGSRTTQARLNAPVGVHMIYMTSWVDADGTVQFRNDIYSRDGAFARTVSAD